MKIKRCLRLPMIFLPEQAIIQMVEDFAADLNSPLELQWVSALRLYAKREQAWRKLYQLDWLCGDAKPDWAKAANVGGVTKSIKIEKLLDAQLQTRWQHLIALNSTRTESDAAWLVKWTTSKSKRATLTGYYAAIAVGLFGS